MFGGLKQRLLKLKRSFRSNPDPFSEDELKWRYSLLFTLIYDVHRNGIPPIIELEMDVARITLDEKDQPIHQPLSLIRYLARELGLAGIDEWEAMYIDATVDSLCVFNGQLMKVLTTTVPTSQLKLKNNLLKRVMPAYLRSLEEQVEKNNGYCIGGKMSWADLFFAVIFEQLWEVVPAEELKVLPRLLILLDKVLKIPSLSSWKSNRAPTDSLLFKVYHIC